MKKLYSILSIMLCLFIAGCDDDSNDATTPSPIVKSDVEYSAAGGTGSIELLTAGIKATSSQTWCAVTVSGKIATLTVEQNLSLESRHAMITLKEGDVVINQVPVTQTGNKVPIPDVKSVTLETDGTAVKVHVTSVLPYISQPTDSWLETKIEGDTLILWASANYSKDARKTTLNLVNGELTAPLTVSQKGVTLVPESTEVFIGNAGETFTIKVNSSLDFTAVSDKPEWLTATANGKTSVKLVAMKNPTPATSRTATVTLTSYGVEATFTVTQNAYGDFIGKWTLNAKNGGADVEFTVTIKQKTAGKTYSATGFGGSSLATNFPIQVNYDAATNLIYIINQGNLGKDAEGNTVAFTAASAKYGIVTGNFIGAMGQLVNNTINWVFGTVDLGEGKEPIVGMGYRFQDPQGGWHIYNTDGTLSDMVMTKSTSSSAISTSSDRSFTQVEKVNSAK